MATKLDDGDLTCFAVDNDTAVISIKDQKFVVDYSTLMDFLTELAVVASQVEEEEMCVCQRVH